MKHKDNTATIKNADTAVKVDLSDNGVVALLFQPMSYVRRSSRPYISVEEHRI